MFLYMVKPASWPVERFAALLDRIVDETGQSQAQLAALVPIDQSQFSRWKSGRSRPRFESLVALGKRLRERYPKLDVGPDDLLAAAGYEADAGQRQPSDVHDTETSPAAGRVSTVEEAIAAAMAQINAVAAANHEELLQALAEQREQIEQQNAKIDRQNAKIIELSRKLDADEDQDGGERKAI